MYCFYCYSQVGINTGFPDTTSVLDIKSPLNDKGVLIPMMTTVQINAISNPATGLIVMNSASRLIWVNSGTPSVPRWVEMNTVLKSNPVTSSFSSGTLSLAIPNNSTAGTSHTINVTGIPKTLSVFDYPRISQVCLNITHTYDADLDITLTSPDGTTFITLSDDNGDDGNNYTNTCFKPIAGLPISSGIAPLTGSFQPEIPFSLFNGQNINGNWTLKVADDAAMDTGTLTGWSIEFQH
ncbi:proprotein convertase P-domain-containing protein [Chryseobacterium chendengshani]|uniref:proprotein convertase P-domain-containing protein n=1 Tax=Chryseobacterium sp. LJ668 TaxID=2864040 RepID=UPI001C689206|nr:proprotein convertase P-domain-containing protein [Chryseobacterium sp. LJ668]MBW8523573.1 proprotein convertase P-domain-containing protein [Chryseobacterium sp. LJ668]QYK15856.1 proprotein convertase P-domain-containing protein [Chryseobacterium sp. LJ668]